MSARVQLQPTLYEQLESLPEGVTGEILNGQLYTHPRPVSRHIRAATRLDRILGRYFDEDDEDPSGWWIFPEPELHFIHNTEVDVPDLAGWRRERMPDWPEGHRFTVVPDWVCEVLSKSTAKTDREVKMPIYAHFGVAYAWLIDPRARTLEAYALDAGAWRDIGRFAGAEPVSVAPFETVTIDLGKIWVPRSVGVRRGNDAALL
ncbi:MAG: Uma2 family endonuclease [Lamprocystis purpurea]|jgi:Uma2 family endonuclease|uniref:Uma2 family endonuclease n=1 Tax=Lamprocystis purpurea TaxID=61598 RepID=UPI00036532DD|nr:Uma2 family endonuclease [Lamprocystis purpurea]MBV5273188.1 Uma2 family endonuclease [Lamprocystis purpurea]